MINAMDLYRDDGEFQDCWGTLTMAEARTVWLHDVEQRPVVEISDLLGTRVGDARRLLGSGYRKLNLIAHDDATVAAALSPAHQKALMFWLGRWTALEVQSRRDTISFLQHG